jgi:hypothetical protein
MKHLLLAALAASFAASVVPAFAKTELTLGQGAAVSPQQDIERRSGRCPGGERRFFVSGCGGV